MQYSDWLTNSRTTTNPSECLTEQIMIHREKNGSFLEITNKIKLFEILKYIVEIQKMHPHIKKEQTGFRLTV